MQVAVLGAGTMGHGIAQVSAMAGHEGRLRDVDQGIVDDKLATIESNLDGGIERGKVTESQAEATLDILEHLREELGERFRPPQILKRKVRAGKLGKKTGDGFYVWADRDIVGISGREDTP